MIAATERQKEVLRAIISCGCKVGLRELADLLKLASPNNVSGHVEALQKKGMLTRPAPGSRRKARTFEVTPKGYRAVGDDPRFHRTLAEALAENGLDYHPGPAPERQTIFESRTGRVLGESCNPEDAWEIVRKLEDARSIARKLEEQ